MRKGFLAHLTRSLLRIAHRHDPPPDLGGDARALPAELGGLVYAAAVWAL